VKVLPGGFESELKGRDYILKFWVQDLVQRDNRLGDREDSSSNKMIPGRHINQDVKDHVVASRLLL
jgi:hypothetical protein